MCPQDWVAVFLCCLKLFMLPCWSHSKATYQQDPSNSNNLRIDRLSVLKKKKKDKTKIRCQGPMSVISGNLGGGHFLHTPCQPMISLCLDGLGWVVTATCGPAYILTLRKGDTDKKQLPTPG